MPYQSVFGNSNTPSNNVPRSGGGYKSVFGSNTTWTNTQPSQASIQKPSQPTQTPNPTNGIMAGLGGLLGNAAQTVQSWFTPTGGQPTPVKLTASQVNQIQQAPAGLKVGDKIPNYTPPTGSAQLTKTTNNIIDTSNYFPGVLDTLKEIGVDPLNLQADPKKAFQDAANTVVSAVAQESIRWSDFLKTANSNAPISAKIGSGLQVVTGAANYAFAPISAFFSAANDIPVVGTASKLITLPFTVAGEGATNISNGIIDRLPIPSQIKTNLKPAIGEIAALAAQLALGKITFVDESTTAKLTKKYGTQDATTIIDQAKNMAETHPTDGTLNVSPTQATTIVTKSNLQDTPAGKEILKNAAVAQQSGDNLVISITPKDGVVPEGTPLNIETPGGATITDIQLGKPLDQVEPTQTVHSGQPVGEVPGMEKPNTTFYSNNPKEAAKYAVFNKDVTGESQVVSRDIGGLSLKEVPKAEIQDALDNPEIRKTYDGVKFDDGQGNMTYALFDKTPQEIMTIKTPDDHIFNPILQEIDKQLNGTIEDNGTSTRQESNNTETQAVQSENNDRQNTETSNSQSGETAKLSNESTKQTSQVSESSVSQEGNTNSGSNQGVERVNSGSESTNTGRNENVGTNGSRSGIKQPGSGTADRTSGSGQSLNTELAAKQINDTGGVTINKNGDQPTEGYAYSPSKDTEKQIPAKTFLQSPVKHLQDYIDQHTEELKDPTNHLGVWSDNGIIYLDISKVGDATEATLKSANDAQQLAVYDLKTGETIQTDYGKKATSDNTRASSSENGSQGNSPSSEKSSPKPTQNQGLKVSKIAKEIEAKAVEQGAIEDGVDKLAGYKEQTFPEQIKATTDLVNNHLDDVKAILRGEKALPKDVNPSHLIAAVREYIKQNPTDIETLQELAKSNIVTKTSEAAQIMGAARTIDKSAPDEIIRRLQDDRKAVIEKQYGESMNHVIKKEVTKGGEQIDRQLRSNSGSKGKLADFIKELQC